MDGHNQLRLQCSERFQVSRLARQLHQSTTSTRAYAPVPEDAPTWPMSWLLHAPTPTAPSIQARPDWPSRDTCEPRTMAAAPCLAWPTEIRAPHPTTTCACLPLRGDGHRKESSPRPGPPPRPHLSAGPEPAYPPGVAVPLPSPEEWQVHATATGNRQPPVYKRASWARNGTTSSASQAFSR